MLEVSVIGRPPAGLAAKQISRLAATAWKRAGGTGAAEMSLSIVDDRRIRALNRTHRGKDKVTDVLSFGQAETRGLPEAGRGAVQQLGDVFISLPQVRRQAKVIGRNATQEFALMVVHGVLHLLGHDHETLAQEKRMFALQHDILSKTGYF